MSYSLEYYSDPGIAFDISKMLFVKLNPEAVWIELLTSLSPHLDEKLYIQNCSNMFPSPPSELLLFSYLPANRKSTFLTTLFTKMILQDFRNFSLSNLDSYFSDINHFQTDLLEYFLGEQNYALNDLEYIIRQNKYITDKIKLLLLGFLLNPNKYICRLFETIQVYFDCIQKHLFIQDIPISDLISFINLKKQNTKSFNMNQTISYSLCFTTPDYLSFDFDTAFPFLITTVETVKQLLEHTDSPYISSLIASATALNDKYRIGIINLLVKKAHLTVQEIASSIGLSVSATNHHLSLLKKAHIVNSVRCGRNVLYSFIPDGFQNITDALNKITKGGNIQ